MPVSQANFYEFYKTQMVPSAIRNGHGDGIDSACNSMLGEDRWTACSHIGLSFGYFAIGDLSALAILLTTRGVPDILKNLSMDGKDVNKLCYSANMGALSATEGLKLYQSSLTACVAMGIEMAMLRDGPTRLTTRAVDIEGLVYTENGNKVSHLEEEGERYYTHVPDESIALRLSRFKKYKVFWYGNIFGPPFFARFLNCIMLHCRNLHTTREASFQGAQLEILQCYVPLFMTGVRTVREDKDAFVITNEIVTAVICYDKFEILGDVGELLPEEQLGWDLLKFMLVHVYVRKGFYSLEEALYKYPELIARMYSKELDGYILGPETTFDRPQKTARAGEAAVEHLGDNRDIPQLTEKRRINGFGTAVPPPETNSSISTVGRRAPTFSIEGRTYKFQFAEGRLAFEVIDDDDGSKVKRFTKKNRIKLKAFLGEVDKVIESPGDCDSLADLVQHYIHNEDDVAGRIWLLAALRSRAGVSDDSACIFDAVSRPSSEGQLEVKSSVKCDFLEAIDVFVSNNEKDPRIFLDYSRKAGVMLGIWGTGGIKHASAVEVDRSKLLRARIVLDYDVRCNSYIGSRS